MKCQPFVPVEFTVFSIAHNRMSLVGEMHTYLIFPAGQKIDFEQAELLSFFEYLISGLCKFAFLGVGCGIDDEGFVLSEI